MNTKTLEDAIEIQKQLNKLYEQKNEFNDAREKPHPTDEDKTTWPNYKIAFHNARGYVFTSLDKEFSEKVVQLYYATLCENIAILERKFAEL